MKPYNKSIELFGISGSGKSYTREIIKKYLLSNGYKIYDTREIIINFVGNFVELTLYQKIKIFYYKFLLIFNIKTTLWNNDLNNICQKFLNKNKKKIDKLSILKKKILSNQSIKNFKLYNIWFDELFVAQLLFEQIKNRGKIIFFPDEVVQRIFILAYISNNINLKQIEKYFKYISQGKILINLISSSKKIDNEISKRYKNKKGWIADKNQIQKMRKIEKIINKHKKLMNIFYMKNEHNLRDQILKILIKNKLSNA